MFVGTCVQELQLHQVHPYDTIEVEPKAKLELLVESRTIVVTGRFAFAVVIVTRNSTEATLFQMCFSKVIIIILRKSFHQRNSVNGLVVKFSVAIRATSGSPGFDSQFTQ